MEQNDAFHPPGVLTLSLKNMADGVGTVEEFVYRFK